MGSETSHGVSLFLFLAYPTQNEDGPNQTTLSSYRTVGRLVFFRRDLFIRDREDEG